MSISPFDLTEYDSEHGYGPEDTSDTHAPPPPATDPHEPKEPRPAPEPPSAQIIDLMEALRAALAASDRRKP